MDQVYFCCLSYRCKLTTHTCKMRQLKKNDEICLACGEVVVSEKQYSWVKHKNKVKIIKVEKCSTSNDMKRKINNLLVGQCIEIPMIRQNTKLQQNTIHNIGRKLKRSYKTSRMSKKRMMITRIQ